MRKNKNQISKSKAKEEKSIKFYFLSLIFNFGVIRGW
jgi:hypothetical protein